MLTINVCLLNSPHVLARDQNYLDTINEEAQNLGEIDHANPNTGQATTVNRTNERPKPAAEDQSTFLQQIHSKLYSNGDNESAYLKQLENEVQDLSKPALQRSANTKPNNAGNPRQASDLAAEQEKVIQITEAQRKEMELTLESKIPGIYNLYKKLGLTQKRIVVKEYLSNEKISTASKTILRLYGGN